MRTKRRTFYFKRSEQYRSPIININAERKKKKKLVTYKYKQKGKKHVHRIMIEKN